MWECGALRIVSFCFPNFRCRKILDDGLSNPLAGCERRLRLWQFSIAKNMYLVFKWIQQQASSHNAGFGAHGRQRHAHPSHWSCLGMCAEGRLNIKSCDIMLSCCCNCTNAVNCCCNWLAASLLAASEEISESNCGSTRPFCSHMVLH